jgi:hypothetical protein
MDIGVQPSADPHSQYYQFQSQLSRDLELTIEAAAQAHGFDAEHEKMLYDGLIYGTGIHKTVWDASVDDGFGNGLIKRIDPYTFYPDPYATDDETGNYFFEVRDISLQELDRRFPGSAELIIETGGGEEAGTAENRPNLYSGAGRAPMANPAGISGAPPRYGMPGEGGRVSIGSNWYDRGVTLYEAWLREHALWQDPDGEPYVEDRWRVVCMAGNRILLDEPATELFGHGRHPYGRFVYGDMGEFWGISLVEHLASLQLSLNRCLAAMQHHAELTGNPVWVEDSQSGLQRVKVTNKPGLRITKRMQGDAKWMVPPPMGSEVNSLIEFYINEMERVSGLTALARGLTPSGRNAQGVLDAVQESAFVRVRHGLRNLERCARTSYRLLASLIAENYTAPRLMAVVGPGGEKTALALRSRHFYTPTVEGASPLKFSLWVNAGSRRPTSRMARASEAERMFALNAIDRQALLEAKEYPNYPDVLQRMQQLEAAGVAQADTSRKRSR